MYSCADSKSSRLQQRVWVTQYVSIMFLILGFVVATFSRAHLPPAPQVTSIHDDRGLSSQEAADGVERRAAPPLSAALVGALEIPEAFDAGGDHPKVEALGGLVAALRSHDLGVELTVGCDAVSLLDAHACLELALRRVSGLRQWLEEQGIPSRAIALRGGISHSRAIKVRFLLESHRV